MALSVYLPLLPNLALRIVILIVIGVPLNELLFGFYSCSYFEKTLQPSLCYYSIPSDEEDASIHHHLVLLASQNKYAFSWFDATSSFDFCLLFCSIALLEEKEDCTFAWEKYLLLRLLHEDDGDDESFGRDRRP